MLKLRFSVRTGYFILYVFVFIYFLPINPNFKYFYWFFKKRERKEEGKKHLCESHNFINDRNSTDFKPGCNYSFETSKKQKHKQTKTMVTV